MQRAALLLVTVWVSGPAADAKCSDWGEDCSKTRCCSHPGATCYRKHEWYSACLTECDSSLTIDGENWNCTRLGERTPSKDPNHTVPARNGKHDKAPRTSARSKATRPTAAGEETPPLHSKHSEHLQHSTDAEDSEAKTKTETRTAQEEEQPAGPPTSVDQETPLLHSKHPEHKQHASHKKGAQTNSKPPTTTTEQTPASTPARHKRTAESTPHPTGSTPGPPEPALEPTTKAAPEEKQPTDAPTAADEAPPTHSQHGGHHKEAKTNATPPSNATTEEAPAQTPGDDAQSSEQTHGRSTPERTTSNPETTEPSPGRARPTDAPAAIDQGTSLRHSKHVALTSHSKLSAHEDLRASKAHPASEALSRASTGSAASATESVPAPTPDASTSAVESTSPDGALASSTATGDSTSANMEATLAAATTATDRPTSATSQAPLASTTAAVASPPETTTEAASASTTSRAEGCAPCTPRDRSRPDVVIPFWEHDLCKVGYTVGSIGLHDPHRVVGTVVLMWVSLRSPYEFQEAIDRIKGSLHRTHKVKFVDLSPQVNNEHVAGWLAQQVFKLKVASMVESDYYVVLDAKNTLVRDLEPDAFFARCNQGKIFGEYEPDEIPQPHADWYRASASALGVQPPEQADASAGRWPSSITPMVMHRRTVLDMLDFMHEDRSIDRLCNGPLCEMLGAYSMDGQGATEFTLFVLFARSQPDVSCHMAVENTSQQRPMAISLWRGLEGTQMEVNLYSCRAIASGEILPYMFGSQTASLEAMTHEQRQEAHKLLVKIYTAARLHNNSRTSSDALIRCVAGDTFDEAVAGPIEDLEQARTEVPGAGAHDGRAEPGDEDGGVGAGDFCCTNAQSSSDVCSSCWDGARLFVDSYCGSSRGHCAHCQGTWCSSPSDEPNGSSQELRLRVKVSCKEFGCDGYDADGCECTAMCEQLCVEDLLTIRMAKKFSQRAASLSEPSGAVGGWATAALSAAVLVALPAAVQALARRMRGSFAKRREHPERQALVAEDGRCLA